MLPKTIDLTDFSAS